MNRLGNYSLIHKKEKLDFVNEMAFKILNSSIASTSDWARELGVSRRTVQAWASKEEKTSKERSEQILYVGKKFLIDILRLSSELDEFFISHIFESGKQIFRQKNVT